MAFAGVADLDHATIPISDPIPYRSLSTETGPAISSLPGTGPILSLDATLTDDKLTFRLLRGVNEGLQWDKTVPVSGKHIHWRQALPWRGPCPVNPGNEPETMAAALTACRHVVQGFWHNEHGRMRTIPIDNGVIRWGDASDWHGPLGIDRFPGTNDFPNRLLMRTAAGMDVAFVHFLGFRKPGQPEMLPLEEPPCPAKDRFEVSMISWRLWHSA